MHHVSSSRASAPRRPVAVLAALAVLFSAFGVTVATAAPITPAYPTVFISQTSDYTTLKQATQSRFANAGAGGVEIASLVTAGFAYNAIAFRTADNYIYGIASDGQLVRVEDNGTATQLGAISGVTGGLYSGAFGEGAYADTYFARPTGSSTSLYSINVTTRQATTITLSQAVECNDFTWADGYLWGVEPDGTDDWRVVRISPTGAVTTIPTTGVFPDTTVGDTGTYGAAWTYGNGNIAVSHNGSGNITQFSVTNPTAALPTVTKVSTIKGPATSQNDATTTPSSLTDLVVTVADPAPAAPSSSISWTITVTNDGPGGSSGSVVSFPVPTGVTDVALPTGCTQAADVVQCVTGPLPNVSSDLFVFSATSPAAGAVSATSPVTIVGNEADPNSAGATLTVTPLPTQLTSSGYGTTPQTTTVTIPTSGTLSLLDGDGHTAASVTVPGEGTYTANSTTGVITFTPDLGYVGEATPVAFTVTTSGGSTSGDYTPTVLPPAAPVVPDLTTSGVSPDAQQATLPALPAGGSVTLLDAGGNPAASVTVAGQGTYVLGSGVITFTPEPLYTGEATPVTYRVTDAYAQTDVGTYTPTVTAPAGPVAVPLTSTDAAPEVQSPSSGPIAIPTGGSVTLLDAGGNPAASVTVASQGTYALDPATGEVTFEPELGFVGAATSVEYRITDAYGQSDESTYTPTVTAPPAPTAPDETTSGVGTTPQSTTFPIPTGGSITLLDADGHPTLTVTVPDEGTYTLDPATGEVTFVPELGFHGTATPVDYRVTDAYAQTADGTYTPDVVLPAPPTTPDLTSTGPAVTPQQTTVPVPTGGSITLLDADGHPTASITVPDVGTYTLDPATGTIVFTPVFGFSGSAPDVDYRVTDAYGQSDDSTYTPTVTAPPAPTAPDETTSGVGTTPQSTTFPIPTGGSITLLDADGDPTLTVTVPDEGTYTLDPATGEVTFVPELGFHGTATPVDYRVTDAYAQTADGTYTPDVVLPAPPTTPDLTSTGPAVTPQQTIVPVPTGGSITLLDAHGDATASITVPDVGTYTLDPATGTIVFTPVFGFSGSAPDVDYRVTDAYGQTAEGTYSPDVVPPAPPAAPDEATTGIGTTPHSTDVVIPTGGSVTLLDAYGDPVLVVTVPDEGTYTLDPATGEITFEPVLGFHGDGSVDYRVTDAYGQSTTGSYVPTVQLPAGPGAPSMTSSGAVAAPQSPRSTIPVPTGGSVRLINASGNPTLTVTVAGQGTYAVDPATGTLTFTPDAGFTGTASPVTYRVIDAYGQAADGTYTAVVAAAPAAAPAATLPRTGGTPFGLAMLAVGLLLGGAALVLGSRRRSVT